MLTCIGWSPGGGGGGASQLAALLETSWSCLNAMGAMIGELAACWWLCISSRDGWGSAGRHASGCCVVIKVMTALISIYISCSRSRAYL